LVKNLNFDQQVKLWSKIVISVKERIFLSKIEFVVTYRFLLKNRIFGQKANVWSKIETLIKKKQILVKKIFG